jgi:hypothetical protein
MVVALLVVGLVRIRQVMAAAAAVVVVAEAARTGVRGLRVLVVAGDVLLRVHDVRHASGTSGRGLEPPAGSL